MVELQHGQQPADLIVFNQQNPNATPADFNGSGFHAIKLVIKQALHRDQAGLCVYCEKRLEANEGQIEHIKPKATHSQGQTPYPQLAFTYSNFAHGCTNNKTCGQTKKSGLLPIEPAPGCNAQWQLSTTGSIEPIHGLTRANVHDVRKTRDMLQLNDAGLMKEREDWLKQLVNVAQTVPQGIDVFLEQSPFRYILRTAI
jgi:uncharacterized protein (TIGR02646 family)